MIGGLAFLAPFALIALVALPALWWLLRLTPPPPRRLPLPTLPLVRDIIGKDREPSRTPLWLLLLRLLAAAAIILAVAGPQWRQDANPLPAANGPLIVLLDDGFAAAPDWRERIDRAAGIINDNSTQPILLITASDERPPAQPDSARMALQRLNSLAPQPHRSSRETMFGAAASLLTANATARAVWIADGLADPIEQSRIETIERLAGGRMAIVAAPTPPLTIAGATMANDGVEAVMRRASGMGPAAGLVRAYDDKGRILGDSAFAFASDSRELRTKISLPLELLNEISRLEVADARSAGAVHLLDSSSRRRRVALVSGETTDTAQPLVSARYFVARAIQPYSDLREPPRGTPDPILRALEERPDVLILADIGTITGETANDVIRFVENGGMLIRFAGPGLAAASDELLPVRLRRGGRILGGALSWEKPQQLAPFPEASPFAGLPVRDQMQVERQVLAEPDSDLTKASWAVLEDGTPLVTGAQRGRGQIVLFHVTADTSWSRLPISGLFVDLLRRCLQLASGRSERTLEGTSTEKLAPRLTLNGFGALSTASALARPVDARHVASATRDHPPGLYGSPEASLAVNAVTITDELAAIRLTGRPYPLQSGEARDLRAFFAVMALLLLLIDGLAVLWLLRGGLMRRRVTATSMAVLVAASVLPFLPAPAFAQQPTLRPVPAPLPGVSAEDMRSALRPRIAYVVTGNAAVDEASRFGLAGIGAALTQRTSISLDEPVGIDPSKDDLVFYPMLYWPILPDQARPPEAAIKALDNFMKNGGTVVFDTRDAFVNRSGSQPSAETRALRRLLASLDIPTLEPVPNDHVLTKTFYLLDRMVGRYVAGDTWVEALVGARDTKVPARAGDRVSPIIITSNDFAAAWAVDRLGRPMFPLVPGEPRQREFALRTGINLMMYVMTGNYKADQVHVPALLERLGQ
jgi:hypothetical protein